MRYANRREAGQLLADELLQLDLAEPRVVLALPRGGVPVAAEIAERLGAPLAPLLVRKIGAPGRPELAMGAVAMIGGRLTSYRNREVMADLDVADAEFDRARAREEAELVRRALVFGGTRTPELDKVVAIVVDDGLATGSTMRAATAALRRLHPASIIAAVPVGSAQAVHEVGSVTDRVVCLSIPRFFVAVGQAYADFHQLSDAEVAELLRA